MTPNLGLETHETGTTNLNEIINGNWYILDEAFGAVGGAVGITTLAYAATIELDLQATKRVIQCLVTGAVEVEVTNHAAGYSRRLILVGDGTDRAVTWPVDAVWSGEALATLAAGEIAVVDIDSRDTDDAGLVLTWAGRGAGGGGGGATPSWNDQEITCLAAASQGDAIATPGLSATPAGRVDVFVNGLRYTVGDAVKTKGVYFSGNGGTTARAHSAIVSGDTCHLGTTGATIGGTSTSDTVSFLYSV